ncbi:Rho termination factor N-terminal domain-containing protein, partial [Georgenia thermotolerans]
MTDTVEAPQSASRSGRGGSLTTMRLPELQALASEMGLKGTTKMRKSDLIAAIRERRGEGAASAEKSAKADKTEKTPAAESAEKAPAQQAGEDTAPAAKAPAQRATRARRAVAPAQAPAATDG